MAALYLTVNEAAELSSVPTRNIEETVEEGVVTKKVIKDNLCAVRAAHVPVQL